MPSKGTGKKAKPQEAATEGPSAPTAEAPVHAQQQARQRAMAQPMRGPGGQPAAGHAPRPRRPAGASAGAPDRSQGRRSDRRRRQGGLRKRRRDAGRTACHAGPAAGAGSSRRAGAALSVPQEGGPGRPAPGKRVARDRTQEPQPALGHQRARLHAVRARRARRMRNPRPQCHPSGAAQSASARHHGPDPDRDEPRAGRRISFPQGDRTGRREHARRHQSRQLPQGSGQGRGKRTMVRQGDRTRRQESQCLDRLVPPGRGAAQHSARLGTSGKGRGACPRIGRSQPHPRRALWPRKEERRSRSPNCRKASRKARPRHIAPSRCSNAAGSTTRWSASTKPGRISKKASGCAARSRAAAMPSRWPRIWSNG